MTSLETKLVFIYNAIISFFLYYPLTDLQLSPTIDVDPFYPNTPCEILRGTNQ